MTTLEDLYYGNIHPNEKRFERTSEYAKFAKIAVDKGKKLTAFLNALPNAKEERHLFEQMVNAESEISAFSEFERFIEGFRLGAGIMLKTFILPQQSVIRDID